MCVRNRCSMLDVVKKKKGKENTMTLYYLPGRPHNDPNSETEGAYYMGGKVLLFLPATEYNGTPPASVTVTQQP